MAVIATAIALSTGLIPLDPTAPGFWFKTYSIPAAYCTQRIAVEVGDVDRLLPQLAPCGTMSDAGPGRVAALCRVPPEAADRILSDLMRRGRLVEFSRDCPPIPKFEELDYKYEALKRETADILSSSAAYPGVSGLLDSQMRTLAYLRARRDQAQNVALQVAVGRPDPAIPLRAPSIHVPDVVERMDDSTAWHPWGRHRYAPCQQVPYVYSEFEVTQGSKDEARVLAAARDLGEPFADAECELWNSFKPFAAVRSAKPVAVIRKAMTDLPGLRRWSLSPKRQYAQAIPDDERVALLEGERLALSGLLERAPTIRAFLDAELERLRPNAAALADLRRTTLVFFRRAERR